LPGKVFRCGTKGDLRAVDDEAVGPRADGVEVDAAVDQSLGEISASSLEAVRPDGDGPLDLVGLEDLDDFGQWKDVHHLAHHVVVVVVVVAEVATETAEVLLAAPFGIAEVGEILKDPESKS